MLNNNYFWVADNNAYYDFNTSTNTTSTGNSKTGGTSALNFVRSVRTFSF